MDYEICCKPYKRPQNVNTSKSNNIELEKHTVTGSNGDDYKIIIKWVFRHHEENSCWLYQCGCSCPSWTYQKKRSELRTCKHLKSLRGDFPENMRCMMNQEFFGGENYAPKPKKPKVDTSENPTQLIKELDIVKKRVAVLEGRLKDLGGDCGP